SRQRRIYGALVSAHRERTWPVHCDAGGSESAVGYADGQEDNTDRSTKGCSARCWATSGGIPEVVRSNDERLRRTSESCFGGTVCESPSRPLSEAVGDL